jgi:predicted O-methyltransferase YrrM
MNAVLENIYATKTVTDGVATYSALNVEGLPTYMDEAEGRLLQRVLEKLKPQATLEIGMAYGVSTIYICEALSKLAHPVTHIVLDPFQHGKWHGVGVRNVREAGFESYVQLLEERSEAALPKLLERGVRVDFALIDSLHTFEQCALEFYYVDRLLNLGGIVVFDDADWRSINRVVRLALSYGSYQVHDASKPPPASGAVTGRIRRALRWLPFADRVIRRDLLYRDWDLGIDASCVALQKTAAETRGNTFWSDF